MVLFVMMIVSVIKNNPLPFFNGMAIAFMLNNKAESGNDVIF